MRPEQQRGVQRKTTDPLALQGMEDNRPGRLSRHGQNKLHVNRTEEHSERFTSS